MSKDLTKIRDEILLAMLPNVPFDGWTWAGAVKAAAACGYDRRQLRGAFDSMADIVDHFADWADREMLKRLERIDPKILRVRDRVRTAVLARFDVLEPHREAERYAVSFWSLPLRHIRAGKIVWRCADRIWNWAGDTAEDYNRYTKRVLLSGILSASTLVWLDDDSDDMEITRGFLDRRIENVMQLGRIIGKMKSAA